MADQHICIIRNKKAPRCFPKGFFYLAGVEGLEPPAPDFGDRYFKVIQDKMVAFVLNTAHHLPSIPKQFCTQTVPTRSSQTSPCYGWATR